MTQKITEAWVKTQVKALCKRYKRYYSMPVMSGYASNGEPDFHICHSGFFVAVETKAGKNTPTRLQLLRMAEIRAAGGIAFVVNENNLDVLEELLKHEWTSIEDMTAALPVLGR